MAAVVLAGGVEVAGDREGGVHTAVSWVRVWIPLGRNVREIWLCWPWQSKRSIRCSRIRN